MAIYDVYTDLDPDELTEVAMETYLAWVSFALGAVSLGGRTLGKDSGPMSQMRGRYALSISWKKDGPNRVAIIADETIAPEALWIEEGTAGANMKEHMLTGGKAKVDKDGYLYRNIPLRGGQKAPQGTMTELIEAAATGHFDRKAKFLWAWRRPNIDSDRWARMSSRPGTHDWVIPPMPAYSPAQIMATFLRAGYGR
jgi:hypothetical protein